MFKHLLLALVLITLASPALAGFDEGKAAFDKKDYKTAILQLRPAAEAGDDRAQVLLGNMYNEGSGVLMNHEEAMRLFKRAAIEKNNTEAMDNIAAMYFSAIGVDQSVPVALQWFGRSASLGDQTGAFFYATIMLEGNRSNPRLLSEPMKAYKWFSIAAGEKQNEKLQAACAQAAQKVAARLLDKPRKDVVDKEIAAWKPVSVKDLGPPPEDPPKAVRRSSPSRQAPGSALAPPGPSQK